MLNVSNFLRRGFTVFLISSIILVSGSAVQTIWSFSDQIVLLLAGISLFLWLLRRGTTIVCDARLFVTLISLFMVCQTYLFDTYTSVYSYIKYVIIILTAYAFSDLISLKQAARIYVKFLSVITLIALIGYVFVNFLNLGHILPVFSNNNHQLYGVGIVFNYLLHVPERNCALFWEPGIFATYLIWGMLAEALVLNEERSVKRLLLFSIGIFTANSTAGFALWVLVLILFFVQSINTGQSRMAYTVISIIALCAVILAVLNIDTILNVTGLSENPYLAKLHMDNVLQSQRMDAISHNLRIFSEAPVTGVGFATTYMLAVDFSDTSTSTFFLSVFGWMGGLITLFWIGALTRFKKLNIYSRILLYTIVLSILNKEPHANFLFTWLVLYLLLHKNKHEVGVHCEKNKTNILDAK